MTTALKPQTGLWILTAPNGKQWQADSPLKACGAEQRERVPAEVGLSRFFAAIAQPVQPAVQPEPVAWRRVNPHAGFEYIEHRNALNGMTNPNWQALYAKPVDICEALDIAIAQPVQPSKYGSPELQTMILNRLAQPVQPAAQKPRTEAEIVALAYTLSDCKYCPERSGEVAFKYDQLQAFASAIAQAFPS